VHILLINSNPVVSKLFALCATESACLVDEVREVGDVEKKKTYAIVCVDDGSYTESVKLFLQEQGYDYTVFLSYQKEELPTFDKTLHKPFLPSQLTEIVTKHTVMERTKEKEEQREATVFSIFPLTPEEKEEEVPESMEEEITHILDGNEIEKIKALLEIEENPSEKSREKKRKYLNEEELLLLQEALSEAVEMLKPKKVKKLLQGKEVVFKLKLKDKK